MARTTVTIVGVAVLATSASGDIVEFFDRPSWEAAVGGVFTLETLEDDPIHELSKPEALLGSGLTIDADPVTITTEVTNDETFSFNTTPGGVKHLRFVAFDDYVATLVAPQPIIAFAFDLSGFQDFLDKGGFAVELTLGAMTVESFFIADPGDFGPTFHGWTSDSAFDGVHLTFLGADFVGLDDIAFTIPGPPALALLAVGMLVPGARRRNPAPHARQAGAARSR